MKITKNNINDVFKSKPASTETMEIKGYELIKELFVDSSGFGADDEPALTPNALIGELSKLIDDNGTVYTTLTNIGQFQVYVGVFKKVARSGVSRVSTNLMEYVKDGTRHIRLYDTDIVSFTPDAVVLNSGGYQTRTSSKWINKYINPMGYRVIQKNWKWFIVKDNDYRVFFDGFRLGID